VERLERGRFDLALIDIEMPRLSGIAVIRKLKAGETPHPPVPVMAITAYVLRANRDAIYAAGADAILPKPLAGIETFGPAIANLLSRDDPAMTGAPAPANGVPSLDRRVRAAGPEGRELLSRLCADLQTVERDLIAGLAHADAAAVRAATHVLIALSGAVGADALLTLARSLNISAHRGETATFP
jgi:two-component system, OmpR family, aerobic respiration control sensor histidine kinase ArcB